ncbi:MAG: ribbon-helix-helix domain-containing protein [Gemmataceae bacterium]
MTITLPDEWREELERKAKASGFATIDEYIAELVGAEAPSVAVPDPPAWARYSVNTQAELTAKLLEGTDTSGDVVTGPGFWERRREAAEARFTGEQLK